MLNQYPVWKYIALIVALVIGIIFALPNLYGEDPAVQVSHRTASVTQEDMRLIEQTLSNSNISIKSSEIIEGRALIRFNDENIQLQAADVLKSSLGKQYLVALNLAPSTPGWLRSLNASPMYLGLDLRGA